MNIILLILEICVAIPHSTPYIIFAANLEDLRSIAKQFIPEYLAEKITNLATNSDVKYRQNSKASYEEDIQDHIHNSRYQKRFSFQETPIKDKYEINIDQIVEKVKDKLKKDIKLREKLLKSDILKQKTAKYTKYKTEKQKSTIKDAIEDFEKETSMGKEYEKIGTESTKKPSKSHKLIKKDEILKQTENSDYIFKKINLKKNDSYEDYEIPTKDPEYYDEEKIDNRAKITNDNPKNTNLKSVKESTVFDDDLKSETENLWHDDLSSNKKKESKEIKQNKKKKYNENDNAKAVIIEIEEKRYENGEKKDIKSNYDSLSYEDTGAENSNIERTKFKKTTNSGTKFPKRDYYKMSTPNYYAMLPVVAETYKFDEPIPVKDQEEENFKYIGNPSASINKKVKLI